MEREYCFKYLDVSIAWEPCPLFIPWKRKPVSIPITSDTYGDLKPLEGQQTLLPAAGRGMLAEVHSGLEPLTLHRHTVEFIIDPPITVILTSYVIMAC